VSGEEAAERAATDELVSDDQLRRAFVAMAIIEACTWAGLLIGMYFKYVPQTTELGVKIGGALHGIAFMGYLAVTFATARRFGWSGRQTVLALASAVPPFATIVFERWAKRRGLLDAVR